MQQNDASFWADIKNYEEKLAQNPDSYLFARLSEVYLKVNLVDDALHTARQGVAKYPTYIAGQRTLAMACHVKGLSEECRQALEVVAAACPEDCEVQRLLGRLFVASGNLDAARKAFSTALDFNPDDECRLELQALSTSSSSVSEEDEIIDLSEDDIIDVDSVEPVETHVHHDPLSTATLAELYVQQGFIEKALDIYRALLVEKPYDMVIQERISELEAINAASAVSLTDSLNIDQGFDVDDNVAAFSSAPIVKPQQASDKSSVVSTLEGWLGSIRRIKACR